jgi:TetR/AcrR family transcriptional repressor of nem operon
MRYAADHKERTGERILEAAAGLFRKQGYAATGVDTVMASAKLTAGGFYGHFRSKENLFAEALDTGFRQSGSHWPERLKRLRGRAWMRAFASFYLSKRHRDMPEQGCPMPTLAPEIGRIGGSSSEVFERHLRGLLATVGRQLDPASPSGRRAIPAVALCVGGLMLARAVKDSALSGQILSACRAAVAEQSADE